MNMVTNKASEYLTSDTQLAAFLVAEGFKIKDVDYSDPHHANFIFPNDDDKLQELTYLFRTAKSRTEPMNYMRIYKRLSSIVRRQLEWYEGII